MQMWQHVALNCFPAVEAAHCIDVVYESISNKYSYSSEGLQSDLDSQGASTKDNHQSSNPGVMTQYEGLAREQVNQLMHHLMATAAHD